MQSISQDGLWLEGIEPSKEERDITITLVYTSPESDIMLIDTVKATVVMINLGNGVYREAGIPGAKNRGHAGLITGYSGTCTKEDLTNEANYEVIEMHHHPEQNDLTGLTQNPKLTYWNIYTNSEKTDEGKLKITYKDRLKVIEIAKLLPKIKYYDVDDDEWKPIGYPDLGNDVLEPENWDRVNLKHLKTLRCDGLVELCYEWNNINVWGKLVSGNTHYDITHSQQYLTEHNETGGWQLFINWERYLYPATQCAHEYSEQDNCWDTTFKPQKLTQPYILRR